MRNTFATLAVIAAIASPVSAIAYETGDWLGRFGLQGMYPESGTLQMDDSYSLGVNLTYMVDPNFGVEFATAFPTKHNIKYEGNTIGNTWQTQPTVFLQYHFLPTEDIRPYVGVGVNLTYFWNTNAVNELQDRSLNLNTSWGMAGQVGVDVAIDKNWFFNTEVAYTGIDANVKVSGTDTQSLEINPWTVGLNAGVRF